MQFNAARFLIIGNTLEICLLANTNWQFYSLSYQAGQFLLSCNDTSLWESLHTTFACAMAQLAQVMLPRRCDWWYRAGTGRTIDLAAFCYAGNRLIYRPSNWARFCHVDRISPLVFLGWRDGRFYVRANAQAARYNVAFDSESCRGAVGKAVRARMARETLPVGNCQGTLRRFTMLPAAL